MEIINPFSDPSGFPEMMKQIAGGNQQTLRHLYGYFYRRLYHFALSMVKIKEAAEEIIEDVFIRIWQQREHLTLIQNLKVYLYTAVKNTSLNYLSKKAKENITESFDHIHTIDAQTAIAISRIAAPLAADFGPLIRRKPLAR